MSEAYTSYYVSQSLERAGWILDEKNPHCNVFQQQSVKSHLSSLALERLGSKRPDFTLFSEARPIAIVEAKKPSVYTLDDALDQGMDYASRIDEVPMVFACNASTIKTIHLDSGDPLYLNGIEVTSFLSPQMLWRFYSGGTNAVSTLPRQVLTDRKSLVKVFSDLNNTLRTSGIRAGIDRFTEFANFLFLKLLSEHKEDDLWDKLVRESNDNLIPYLNDIVRPSLVSQYGGQVIGSTRVTNPEAIRKILTTLNPLQLTSIDEDIKGMAFEQFMQQTTDTQNDLGEYFTPRHIVRFMVCLLDPQYGETVYDPFCGTGGFLTEAFRHVSQGRKMTQEVFRKLQRHTVFGSEITTTARIAKMNMILFGDGHSGVVKQNSIDTENRTRDRERYDNVLTNMPFSQQLSEDVLAKFEPYISTADEACCESAFECIKPGGKMAIVVPEGLLFNKKTNHYLLRLLSKSRVRLVVRLPSGCFNPYTAAKTAIILLTDKGKATTTAFYIVNVKNHGYDTRRRPTGGTNDLDKILWWYSKDLDDSLPLPSDVEASLVSVQTDPRTGRLKLHREWIISPDTETISLSDVAELQNGQSITEKDVLPGPYPVIAGGAGRIAYYHNEFNRVANVITISKSGANAGYVWWHHYPIWSSDSISIRSLDESKYLTKYLFLCLKQKQKEIYERQQGTGQPHVYVRHLKDFPVPVLPLKEQLSLLMRYQELENDYLHAHDAFKQEEGSVLDAIRRSYSSHP